MDTDDIENPFGDGVGDRGVDDDDENIPLISTSSCRGSEDTTYHRTYEETSFTTGGDEKFHEKNSNKPINPVLIVRKLQYDYHAF